MVVYISEYFPTVTSTNATWTFRRPSGFTLFPTDQKFRHSSISESEARKKFSVLHLLFETKAEDARFGVQITCPQEEEAVLRR